MTNSTNYTHVSYTSSTSKLTQLYTSMSMKLNGKIITARGHFWHKTLAISFYSYTMVSFYPPYHVQAFCSENHFWHLCRRVTADSAYSRKVFCKIFYAKLLCCFFLTKKNLRIWIVLAIFVDFCQSIKTMSTNNYFGFTHGGTQYG